MEFSVVVPTLNGRQRLTACLDVIRESLPAAETIVVNGPSTDGTSGMIHGRSDVDCLIEVADRNINAARNAGLAAASEDVVALIDQDHRIEPTWPGAVRRAVDAGADAVTGPVRCPVRGGLTTETKETRSIAGREVTYFGGGNVALTPGAIEELDGFDEYLRTGGARDAAHRLAGQSRAVAWTPAMSVRDGVDADGGDGDPRIVGDGTGRHRGWKYRSLAYRLAKNYGLRPAIVRRLAGHITTDGIDSVRGVIRGETTPTTWAGGSRAAAASTLRGLRDGLVARVRDRTPTRNPRGISARVDRAIEEYDWR